MSAIAAAPLERDVRVISLIGVAHGASHYYQLAFVTMLLIVREKAGLSFTEPAGLLPSSFTSKVLEVLPGRRCRRTSGVLPMQSAMVGNCRLMAN